MQTGGSLNANGAQVVSPFPPPPEYSKHYTPERVAQVCFKFEDLIYLVVILRYGASCKKG